MRVNHQRIKLTPLLLALGAPALWQVDHQRVVFAHDLGPEEDKTLLRYYPDRTALLLTIDGNTGQENLQAYPSSTVPQ